MVGTTSQLQHPHAHFPSQACALRSASGWSEYSGPTLQLIRQQTFPSSRQARTSLGYPAPSFCTEVPQTSCAHSQYAMCCDHAQVQYLLNQGRASVDCKGFTKGTNRKAHNQNRTPPSASLLLGKSVKQSLPCSQAQQCWPARLCSDENSNSKALAQGPHHCLVSETAILHCSRILWRF